MLLRWRNPRNAEPRGDTRWHGSLSPAFWELQAERCQSQASLAGATLEVTFGGGGEAQGGAGSGLGFPSSASTLQLGGHPAAPLSPGLGRHWAPRTPQPAFSSMGLRSPGPVLPVLGSGPEPLFSNELIRVASYFIYLFIYF